MSQQFSPLINPPINVIIDKVTLPPADDLTLTLSIISVTAAVIGAIAIPAVLFWLSRKFNREAQKRADKYVADLRALDNKKIFLDNAHRALDNLYKNIQMLYTVNIKRASQNKLNFKIDDRKK